MLHRTSLKLAAAFALAGFTTLTASGQDAGALVDKLIKKGVLTDQEGEEVRADMMRDFSQTNAGKINIGSSITELKLYGDFPYRYQYDNKQPQVPNGTNENQRSRHRFRLRLAADVNVTDNFYGGFALESGQANDSGNQTFENGFDDFNVFIARAYIGWRPNDWLNVTLGKVKNPFYTTDLIWDSDINPQGLVETVSFHKMPALNGGSEPKWELTLVAGQLFYDDNNEFNLDSDLNTDAYLFVEQLIATWKFDSNTSITIAPAFYTFTAADLTGLTNENAFTDAGDVTFAIPQTQTTVTERDRTVINYDGATGGITGGRVETRRITAVQTSQPSTTANGVTNVNRTTNTRDRIVERRVLTAAQAQAFARENGVPQTLGAAGATGGNPSTTIDGDEVVVSTTAANANRLNAVSGETRQLHILTAPGDISFKLGGLKTKVYWDFAYNFGGRERFEDIYQLWNGVGPGEPRTRYDERDGIAWLVGLQLGETKKKGDWMAFLTYRETGIASIDPNLNDSDFALGELNTRGFKGGVAYAFGDAVVLNITGYMAWNLRENLIGGRATNAPAVADANSINTVQVDLNIKF